MAKVIGTLRPSATYGEQKVLELLRGLPDDFLVWPELGIDEQYLDFVTLHPKLGLAVLEVKDWVEVTEANPDNFTVRARGGQERREPNPVRQARSKAITIANRLERRSRLMHSSGPHKGKLRVPWSYAAILPNLTRMFVFALGDVVEPRTVLCEDDLAPRAFEDRLRGLGWPYAADLSDADIDDIRATLDPDLRVTQMADGAELGVVDLVQEQAAKEGLHDTAQPDADGPADDVELTPEGQRVAAETAVRLVRGVAGSGKTLVLAMRARYLARLHPDWRILVVTFNRALAHDLAQRLDGCGANLTVTNFHALCRDWLDKVGIWQNGPVDDNVGRAANLLGQADGNQAEWDAEFLADEFAWIKDMSIRNKTHYLEVPRLGRGLRLTKKDRNEIWSIFQRYEDKLRQQRRFDWADVPLLVMQCLDDGDLAPEEFDAILIDEAQDFAPTWFEVLRRNLNPAGHSMFMAADSAQRIYRRFSWRSLGLNVVGRTRILPRSYRSTYEIMSAANTLLQGNADLVAELREEEEELVAPDLNPGWMRHGPFPFLLQWKDRGSEVDYLARTITQLLRKEGYRPNEIAVLHRKKHGPANYRSHLSSAKAPGVKLPLRDDTDVSDAVQFTTIHACKGLEYRAVFIVQAQELFQIPSGTPREAQSKFMADELRLLYVAMTRARERLYITYQSKLPPPIEALQEHLRIAREKQE